MDSFSAQNLLGCDDFPIEFYQACWHVLKYDLMEIFVDFHQHKINIDTIIMGYNSNSCLREMMLIGYINTCLFVRCRFFSKSSQNLSLLGLSLLCRNLSILVKLLLLKEDISLMG
jgi:hypothetical protein